MARIGIVVPVYGTKREYLDACVGSLIGQTYRDIQIILVDDCSPDACGDWCEEYARQDKRVAVVHHERNRGLSAARNTGLERLDAQWVTFVDSDDWVDADMCERLARHLDRFSKQPDMVIFSGYRDYPNRELRCAPAYARETWFCTPDDIERLQRYAMRYPCKGYPERAMNLDGAWQRLIRAQYIRRKGIRFSDLLYREDGLFFLYATEQAGRVVYLPEAFYHYRSTGGSMVNSYRPRADEEHAQYLAAVWKFLRDFGKEQAFADDAYYPAFLSMQMCVTQKFFHADNPHSFWARQRACRAYFANEPYASVFRKIHIGSLRRNHRIKALLIRMRLYACVPCLRGLYMLLGGKKSFD